MKKAITPIISVVLLIMLVVAITGGAWVWMTSVQGNLEGTAGEQIEEAGELASTSFNIISAICGSENDYVNLTVMNTGTSSISDSTNWLVTVSHINGTVQGTNTTVGDVVGAIEVGDATTFTIDGGVGGLGNGESYSVKVNVGNTVRSTTCTAN